jgi:predicted transcriptional regulator
MDTKTIIKKLGGGVKTAALCEVTPAAVSQWIGNGIPPARLMFLKLARPEVFDEGPALSRSEVAHMVTSEAAEPSSQA